MTSQIEEWTFAGLGSSFPNIEPDDDARDNNNNRKKTKIASTDAASADVPQPCKILQISHASPPEMLSPEEAQLSVGLKPQALIFRYRNKFHAVDNACPHRSYPLARGSLYDIEDFGIVLSAGIACPKHGWTFDLFTGVSSKGGYKLGVWEVDVRPGSVAGGEEEVWVRKVKRRIG